MLGITSVGWSEESKTNINWNCDESKSAKMKPYKYCMSLVKIDNNMYKNDWQTL